MDPAGFAKYIDFLIGEASEPDVTTVPTSLCTAVVSLIEYLTEDVPGGAIPAPLDQAAARLAWQITVAVNPERRRT